MTEIPEHLLRRAQQAREKNYTAAEVQAAALPPRPRKDRLSPEDRAKLDEIKADMRPAAPPQRPNPSGPPRPATSRAPVYLALLVVVLVGLLVGLVLFTGGGDFRTDREILQETSSCDEVIDIMVDAGRQSGLAEYAHIRYDELGCGSG